MYNLISLDSSDDNNVSSYRLISTKTKQEMERKVRKLCENEPERIFEFVHNMKILGNMEESLHVRVLIVTDHELVGDEMCENIKTDNIDNTLTAIVFADSETDALNLIREHPEYVKILNDFFEEYSDDEDEDDDDDDQSIKNIEKHCPIQFLYTRFDADLGSFVKLPSNKMAKLKQLLQSSHC